AEQRTVPYVAARIVVRSGNDVNPLDKAGLASYALAMLNEGTSTRTAPQIADDLAQIGASLTAASTMDASRVTVSSLSRNFPAALQLLADVVLHPSFPAAEVERQQASRLASLVQQRSNPTAIANAAVAAALYGPQHPYGYTESGTTDSTKRITRDDL